MEDEPGTEVGIGDAARELGRDEDDVEAFDETGAAPPRDAAAMAAVLEPLAEGDVAEPATRTGPLLTRM
jgi:hypothetical protein